MKHLVPILAWLALAPSAFGQNVEKLSVEVLIERLGSANFAVRDQATKALRLRPESEPALRKAIPLANAEVRRRIESLLDYFERGPLRELDEHVQAGRMDDFIKLVAEWPEGKFEDEVWGITINFLEKVYDLHLKKGGTKPLNYPVSAQNRIYPSPTNRSGHSTRAAFLVLPRFFCRRSCVNITEQDGVSQETDDCDSRSPSLPLF